MRPIELSAGVYRLHEPLRVSVEALGGEDIVRAALGASNKHSAFDDKTEGLDGPSLGDDKTALTTK